MRRIFLPILLLSIGWLCMACPMATQSAVPVAPSGGGLEEKVAVSDAVPIEPKTDPRIVHKPRVIANARLRYGKDYSVVLTTSPPYAITAPAQQFTLRFQLDLSTKFQLSPPAPIWEPSEERDQVRLVFTPKGGAESEVSYCDGVWETDEDGKLLLTFPDITFGEGDLNFLLYYASYTDESGETIPGKTSDFHTGDLIPLATGDPTHPFAPNDGTVYDLGTFQVKFMVLAPIGKK